jgi:predicted ATP-dependent endonuclease of OLD family
MQKIIIKNFGAIAYAEIEVKKVLVLIGEQASGKSTIAKLIYFFKSLREAAFTKIYRDNKISNFNKFNDIETPLREKFHNFFGSPHRLSNFEIKFYYDVKENKYINLDVDSHNNKKLQVSFSPNFFNPKIEVNLNKIKKFFQQELNTTNNEAKFIHLQKKNEYLEMLILELNDLFGYHHLDSLFIIAGRNATVSYSNLFSKYLFANLQNTLERNSIQEFELKEQTIDETLMLKFIERVEDIKNFFRGFGSFEGLINYYVDEFYNENEYLKNKVKQNLEFCINNIYEILKGEYIIDDFGEKILLNSDISVDLANASSGQQEVIRILQDIFISIFEQSELLRILEEPEAHLFPIAQKYLIELLALMVNQNDDNQLIITTHSPYVLTVFNNLLFAQRVVDKNPSAEAEVAELIPKEFWLKAKDFSAYSLGNASIHEEPEYCESIFNNQTGAIQQNYLDAVSEMLGGDFNYLYSLYTKTFRRK